MILVNTFVSVITLNVHRLTSQSKDIDWLSGLQNEQTKKQDPTIRCIQKDSIYI